MSAEPAISVTDEVAPGDMMAVSVSTDGNVTLLINAPNGAVFSDTSTGGKTWTVPVTDTWGWGRGSVEAFILLRDGNTTSLFADFQVICPASCMVPLMEDAARDAVMPIWVVLFAVLAISLMFVGHAAHIYRVENGELSWFERVSLLLRMTIRRNPLKAMVLDKTGSLPADVQDDMSELIATAQRLASIEKAVKGANRRKRLLQGEIIVRKKRLERTAGKDFVRWKGKWRPSREATDE